MHGVAPRAQTVCLAADDRSRLDPGTHAITVAVQTVTGTRNVETGMLDTNSSTFGAINTAHTSFTARA
jgi:hypothetical protein